MRTTLIDEAVKNKYNEKAYGDVNTENEEDGEQIRKLFQQQVHVYWLRVPLEQFMLRNLGQYRNLGGRITESCVSFATDTFQNVRNAFENRLFYFQVQEQHFENSFK